MCAFMTPKFVSKTWNFFFIIIFYLGMMNVTHTKLSVKIIQRKFRKTDLAIGPQEELSSLKPNSFNSF